jgi:hypothetical protein
MDAGTVIAIVVPNIVAAIAIVLGWRQQGRGLRHGRHLADLENLRMVLDGAATALHTTAYALDRVRLRLTQHAQGFSTATRERSDSVGRAGEGLDALVERLTAYIEDVLASQARLGYRTVASEEAYQRAVEGAVAPLRS